MIRNTCRAKRSETRLSQASCPSEPVGYMVEMKAKGYMGEGSVYTTE